MRLGTMAAIMLLLAVIVPVAVAQDTAAVVKTAAVKASDFKPPLSAGKQREYDKSSAALASAVRDAMKSGQFRLVSEQTVEAMTVFEAVTTSWRNMEARDKVRIVVEPLSEKQTAVRVLWPAASSFPPGSTAENLYFQAIEARLK